MRFVGRAGYMAVLDQARADARRQRPGRRGSLFHAGGAGKDRLRFKFVDGCRAHGIGVLDGSSVAHGKNVPLLPIIAACHT